MISKNQQKLIRSLELKKYRQREQLFVAEGPKVVGDLLRHSEAVQLFATPQWEVVNNTKTPVQVLTDDELRRISFLQHPQQVLGLFRLPQQQMLETDKNELAVIASKQLVLALDGVQDPGNVGTIIRMADWFGIHHMVCSLQTADAWSPKVIQATMGSIARVKIFYTHLPNFLQQLPNSTPIYGTLLDGNDIYRSPLTPHGVIIMGNEGEGISPDVRQLISHALFIPRYNSTLSEGAESLNVAIATAITCAEFRRRG